MSVNIIPKCQSTDPADYITAEGFVMPCCWMGNQPFIKEYFKLFADCLDEMSIHSRTLKEITEDPRYQRIAETWKTQPLEVCQKMCSQQKKEQAQGQDRYVNIFTN